MAFARPYLEEAKRILARKGSLILCAKESSRRSRDLYLVDLVRVATEEIALRLIDEFCWVRPRVPPVRLGPRRLPDGWLRCLQFSPSSSPETYPEQVESSNGNGKAVTVSPANVLVTPLDGPSPETFPRAGLPTALASPDSALCGGRRWS